MSTRNWFLALFMAACSAACAAPAPESSAPESTPALSTQAGDAVPVPVQTSPAPSAPKSTKPPPSMSDPLPPEVMPTPVTAGKQVVIDQSCKTNADCVVRNVGSCCGAMPACVNKNSAVPDPAAVQAQCAKEGRVSTCGFNPITACTCANGQCVSEQEPVGGWINGAAPPHTDR